MLVYILITAAGFLLVFLLGLYLIQHRMVFHPGLALEGDPGMLGLPYEEVRIEVAEGVRIHGWYVGDRGSTVTFLFCHGNAGNMSHRLQTLAYWYAAGYNIFCFDYRGYGKSDGSPSEDACYGDAEAAYDWLVNEKRIPAHQIVAFGRSLGGAVALELSIRRPCAGLFVESSFTSIADMGKRLFPWLPIGSLLRYEFDSLSKIRKVTCPVLVTHSPEDEIVPFDMGRSLFAAAPEPKRFIELSGGHNDRDYFEVMAYRQAVGWIASAGGDAPAGE